MCLSDSQSVDLSCLPIHFPHPHLSPPQSLHQTKHYQKAAPPLRHPAAPRGPARHRAGGGQEGHGPLRHVCVSCTSLHDSRSFSPTFPFHQTSPGGGRWRGVERGGRGARLAGACGGGAGPRPQRRGDGGLEGTCVLCWGWNGTGVCECPFLVFALLSGRAHARIISFV